MAGWRTATLTVALGGAAVAPHAIGPGDVCATPAGRAAVAAHVAGLPAEHVATAVAVALAESQADPAAVGDVVLQDGTWGPSYGAWQIRSLWSEQGTGGVRDGAALGDLGHNARSMVAVSSGGTNWQPWSVWTSGAYRARLAEGEAVAACGGGGAATTPPPVGERLSALAMLDKASTNLVHAAGDAACPPDASADLCHRWRTFAGGQAVSVSAPPPEPGGFITVAPGMTVAAEAAPSLRAMLASARAEGVELTAVSSLRSSDEQAARRRQNCPDPVRSAPGDCTPPTARVGTSEHETGHAIDFAQPGWRWLAANADRFGWAPTAGLHVEPWHYGYVGGTP